jgi:hypothetical protein
MVFTPDTAEIIEEAFERIGVELRTGQQLRSARRSLNLMFSDWANRGINRWTIQPVEITTVVGQTDYLLGPETIDVLSASLRRSGTSYPMQRVGRSEYFDLPDKTLAGRPNQFYVDRQINPVLKVWLAPDRSTDVLVLDQLTRINSIDAYPDVPGLPFRFYESMVAGLAYNLAMKYAPERLEAAKLLYEECFLRAIQEDRDRASFRVAPYGRGRRG